MASAEYDYVGRGCCWYAHLCRKLMMMMIFIIEVEEHRVVNRKWRCQSLFLPSFRLSYSCSRIIQLSTWRKCFSKEYKKNLLELLHISMLQLFSHIMFSFECFSFHCWLKPPLSNHMAINTVKERDQKSTRNIFPGTHVFIASAMTKMNKRKISNAHVLWYNFSNFLLPLRLHHVLKRGQNLSTS
jgi:hypothetical protein